jgi:TfoX-like protein
LRPFFGIQIKYSVRDHQAAPETADGLQRRTCRGFRQSLARKKGVEEKKMFGCICFLLNGNMLVGVWKDSLFARLGPDQGEEALLEPHVKKMDITGRPMKGWVMVAPEGVEDDGQMKAWIQRAVKFVGQLPGK